MLNPIDPLRELNPIDPRNINHPCHDEDWLALARALGRLDARKEFETIHGKAPDDRTEINAHFQGRSVH